MQKEQKYEYRLVDYIFGRQVNLGMDGLFERDLPASVALAGSYGTRSSSAYLLSSTQALTSAGGRPPGKCQSAKQDKQRQRHKDKDLPTPLVSATAIVGAAVPNCQKCQSVSAITWITCLWGLDCSPGDWLVGNVRSSLNKDHKFQGMLCNGFVWMGSFALLQCFNYVQTHLIVSVF